MAKYISNDKAYRIVLHYGSYVASNKIADMESIELVRCGECKHWDGLCWLIDGHGVNFTDPNDFCSYGEKEDKS